MAFSVIALIELASAFGFELSLVRAANPPGSTTTIVLPTTGTVRACMRRGYSIGRVAGRQLLRRRSPRSHHAGARRVMGDQRSREHRGGGLPTQPRVSQGVSPSHIEARGWRSHEHRSRRSYRQLLGPRCRHRRDAGSRPDTELLLASVSATPQPRDEGRGVLIFSAWVFISSLASFGNMRAADFVLGKTHGATELGHYKLGEEIGQLPGTELVMPINRALLPGVSRMVEDGKTLREVVLAATGVVAVVLVPASLGIHAVAEPLVRVVLGEKWLATIPVVQLMAINSLFLAFAANQHMSFIAAGKPHSPALLNVSRPARLCPRRILDGSSFRSARRGDGCDDLVRPDVDTGHWTQPESVRASLRRVFASRLASDRRFMCHVGSGAMVRHGRCVGNGGVAAARCNGGGRRGLSMALHLPRCSCLRVVHLALSSSWWERLQGLVNSRAH